MIGPYNTRHLGLAVRRRLRRRRPEAVDFRLGPVTAMLLGMVTAIGGGMVRDVLAGEVPSVLRGDIYAVAALAGGGVVVVGRTFHLPSIPFAIAGAVLHFGLRLVAIRRSWQLPGAQRHPSSEG